MSENIQRSMAVYEELKGVLDSLEWKYEEHEEDLTIVFSGRGDDLPMKFVATVDKDIELLHIRSRMPCEIPEEKRIEAALMICATNKQFMQGAFDFDAGSGDIYYYISNTFRGGTLSKEAIEYMVVVTTLIVDKYNDKFFMFAKDMMSFEQYFEWLAKKD